ncbi:adhesion G-protein coupled receptor D1-like [Watersipora subatra]|uniref:adhesion G-protein coupled receptor D1-like n=1 Tax=Watersipora subatra TaxID=2589382 RepID=UPI00355B30D8
MNLIVALALAQLTHVAGITRTSNIGLCKATAVLLHLFYIATFTWMLCEGLQLYFKIIAVFNSERKSNRAIFYAVGWGAPVLIVGVSMAVRLDEYGTETYCWLSREDGLVWAFIGPVCAVILINLCIMARVIKIVISSAKSPTLSQEQRKDIILVKAGVKAVVILTPLLGTNWLFGFMVVHKYTQAFEFLFVILNTFQGIFIFFFHCIGSSEVRSAFMHKRAKRASKSANNSLFSCGSSDPPDVLRKNFFLFEKPKVSGELADGE